MTVTLVSGQHGTNGAFPNTPGTPATFTFTNNIAVGNLVVCILSASSNDTSWAVTDGTNSFTVGALVTDSTAQQAVAVAYLVEPTASKKTLTFSTNNDSFVTLLAAEFNSTTGWPASPLHGSQASNSTASASTLATSTSIGSAGDLVYAGIYHTSGSVTGDTTNLTAILDSFTASGAAMDSAYNVNIGSAIAPSFTWTTGAIDAAIVAAAFTPSAAAGGTPWGWESTLPPVSKGRFGAVGGSPTISDRDPPKPWVARKTFIIPSKHLITRQSPLVRLAA